MINVTINGKEVLVVIDTKGNALVVIENNTKKKILVKRNNEYIVSAGNVKAKDLEMLVKSGQVKIK